MIQPSSLADRKSASRVAARLVGLSLLLAIAGAPAVSGADPKVLFFTKSSGFQHSVIASKEGAPSYAQRVLEELGWKYGFEVVTTKDGGVFDRKLDDFKALIFYTTGDLTTTGKADGAAPMSEKGKNRFLKLIHKQGVGFVGIHSATDTFHSPGRRNAESGRVDPYIDMIGAEFVTHGAQQKARMRVADRSFPGLGRFGEGFELFEEWYSLKNFHPEIHVLLIQETASMTGKAYQRDPYPATWLRYYGKGRVFYTSMGHGEEVWDSGTFQRVLVSGILWSLRDTEADVSSNLSRAAPGSTLELYP